MPFHASWCFVISCRDRVDHKKTNIQFRERVYTVPLALIHTCVLCPVTALAAVMLRNTSMNPSSPSFATCSYVLTQNIFSNRLKCITKLGLCDKSYSAHSLRRGGASWAFRIGLPAEVIQMMGDWRSDAYKLYFETSREQKSHYMNIFFEGVKINTVITWPTTTTLLWTLEQVEYIYICSKRMFNSLHFAKNRMKIDQMRAE